MAAAAALSFARTIAEAAAIDDDVIRGLVVEMDMDGIGTGVEDDVGIVERLEGMGYDFPPTDDMDALLDKDAAVVVILGMTIGGGPDEGVAFVLVPDVEGLVPRPEGGTDP